MSRMNTPSSWGYARQGADVSIDFMFFCPLEGVLPSEGIEALRDVSIPSKRVAMVVSKTQEELNIFCTFGCGPFRDSFYLVLGDE